MAQVRGFALIAQQLPHAPLLPGVYIMKNQNGAVIYVGKAKSLRKRLANYAHEEQFPGYYRHKVQVMVAQVRSLEWMVTHSEKEALILESNLIKLHRPRYNIDLRDDKTYPYFRLSLQDEFPRFHLVRRPERKDGARYWGPLENVGAARRTLDMLQKTFPLRRCSNSQMKNRSRPCLNYEMKRCLAPCLGKVDADEYWRMVRQIEAFFAGQGGQVASELEQNMAQAAGEENFEQAARLRDRLFALRRTLETQQAQSENGDLDAWGLFEDEQNLRIAIIRVRDGQLISSQTNDFSQAAIDAQQAMSQGLLTFYSQENQPPAIILLSQLPEDMGLVVEHLASLKGAKVELRQPQRGEKRAYVELALKNAATAPGAAAAPEPQAILQDLATRLGLPQSPNNIECMDISHLAGKLTVASVVCFVGGKPLRANYRRYKLNNVPPGDDYAAMYQAFTRRLSAGRAWPDLMLIDGGRGQLAMAVSAYAQYEKEHEKKGVLHLASIAKGQEGDKIYVPGRKNPINFRPRDYGLAVLMHLRDEAHRVAVGFHRSLRKKAFTRSILDEISGLGPVNRKKIWRHFASLKELKAASAEDISNKTGVNLPLAKRVEQFLANLQEQTENS